MNKAFIRRISTGWLNGFAFTRFQSRGASFFEADTALKEECTYSETKVEPYQALVKRKKI